MTREEADKRREKAPPWWLALILPGTAFAVLKSGDFVTWIIQNINI